MITLYQELDDLQKSADIHQGLNEWMRKRNYESLKEASEHLHQTLEAHKMGQGVESNEQLQGRTLQDVSTAKFAQSARIRSLKNMQSQALAALVLRKNIISMNDASIKDKESSNS